MDKDNLISFQDARALLLNAVAPLGTERVPLTLAAGRVLARELRAAEDVPSFDRSPYDGYALRSADTRTATREAPVTLSLTEEIPAGAAPAKPVTPGAAAKILTGAPIPPGADAVVMFERTRFTADTVTLFAPAAPGSNIVYRGEDVRAGTVLLRPGQVIDPGAAGVLAAQGVAGPTVYRVPRVGILSTGSELVEADQTPGPGQIRNTNAFTLTAALRRAGMEPYYYGIVGDAPTEIWALLSRALADCDAVITTGGVSVGDYDRTPEAMASAGATPLFRGAAIKPGMACAFGQREGKLLCGLSGNPASALTAFYALALPALRKLAGHAEPLPPELTLRLREDFPKPGKLTRLLRGRLDLSGGSLDFHVPAAQGNAVLSSAVGCDAIAVVPPGSGPLRAGTTLKGFLI